MHLEHYFTRIRRLRMSRGITQKEMATVLGMTPNAYQKYEYGEREPNMATLVALADFFDVSLDYLVGRSDNPKRD